MRPPFEGLGLKCTASAIFLNDLVRRMLRVNLRDLTAVSWLVSVVVAEATRKWMHDLRYVDAKTHLKSIYYIHISPEILQFRLFCNCRPFENSLGNSTCNAHLPRELCNWLGNLSFDFCKDAWPRELQNSRYSGVSEALGLKIGEKTSFKKSPGKKRYTIWP
jgi:hypothetical protein